MTCAHDPCTCPVEEAGAHCGPACRQGIEVSSDAPCACGHDGCDVTH